MSALPPGPSEPPVVQTLRWLLRPISFLESCRRRFGDAFSVSFLGFQTPMVMLSDPEAIRALYTVPGHTLPPGRTLALQPIMGSRSLLLLEGREHLARRKLMLPPFHGARMRAYEATVREVVAREVDELAGGRAVRAAPADAGGHARGDPARGVRRHRLGRAPRAAGRAASGSCWPARRPPGCSSACCSRAASAGPTRSRACRRCAQEIDALLAAEIAARRAEPGEDILSLLVAARFEDGEPMDDAEIRDQLMTLLLAGHETTATGLAWTFDLLLRHPHVLERLARDGDDDAYLRAVVAESLRLRPVVPLAGRRLSEELRVNGHVLPPGHRRDARDLARPHARRTATPSRTRSAPSASSTTRPRPTRGSRSAAACGAASARRSRRWRCASRSTRSCGGGRCGRRRPRRRGSRAAT